MAKRVRRDTILDAHERRRKIAEARREWIIFNITGLVLIIAGLVLTFITMKLILLFITGMGILFLAKATWFPIHGTRIKRRGGSMFPDFWDIGTGCHHHHTPDIDLPDIDFPDIDLH